MHADPRMSNVLESLSEDSLFALKMFLERRVRRATLKANDGKPPADLQPMRVLLTAVTIRHEAALEEKV